MKKVGFIYQTSLGISPSLRLVQKNSRPEKCPCIVTNNWIVLTLRRFVKYFLTRYVSRYSRKVVEKRREAITKCYAFQANAVNIANNKLCDKKWAMTSWKRSTFKEKFRKKQIVFFFYLFKYRVFFMPTSSFVINISTEVGEKNLFRNFKIGKSYTVIIYGNSPTSFTLYLL